jgi:iron complex outermembrane receptor protein
MKRNLLKGLKSRRSICVLLCLVSAQAFTASSAFATDHHAAAHLNPAALIKGKVVDNKGLPLPGATVRVKGTKAATVTDVNGQFSLDVQSGATLVVSFTGYLTTEAKVSGRKL